MDKDEKQHFGLPNTKQYPMPDAAHVRSAIKFFNYVKPSQEKELAHNIIKRMKELGVNDVEIGDKNRLSKYISNDDTIAHYGRLGMKWYKHIYGEYQGGAKYAEKGAALAQKYDSEGKSDKAEKIRSKIGKLAELDAEQQKRYMEKRAIDLAKGKLDVHKATAEELALATNRLMAEKKVKDLRDDVNMTIGKKLLLNWGDQAVQQVIRTAIPKAINNAFDEAAAERKRERDEETDLRKRELDEKFALRKKERDKQDAKEKEAAKNANDAETKRLAEETDKRVRELFKRGNLDDLSDVSTDDLKAAETRADKIISLKKKLGYEQNQNGSSKGDTGGDSGKKSGKDKGPKTDTSDSKPKEETSAPKPKETPAPKPKEETSAPKPKEENSPKPKEEPASPSKPRPEDQTTSNGFYKAPAADKPSEYNTPIKTSPKSIITPRAQQRSDYNPKAPVSNSTSDLDKAFKKIYRTDFGSDRSSMSGIDEPIMRDHSDAESRNSSKPTSNHTYNNIDFTDSDNFTRQLLEENWKRLGF